MSSSEPNKLTILVKRVLDTFWFLLLVAAVIWPITVMIVGVSIPSDPEQRHADVDVFLSFRINTEANTELVKTDASNSELVMKGQGDLQLNNTRSRLSWYLACAISEVMLFIFLYGLLTMRKLFASLIEGNTFTEENSERIRKIGYVLIGWHVIHPLLQYFGSRIMLYDIAFNVPGIELYPAFELNIGGVIAGFAIIVFSGVLREAANMHQEQVLTI